jgi:hypothetical protein
MANTKHFENDRKARFEWYKKLGIGEVIDVFVVDRHRANENIQLHSVTDNAFILVHDKTTKKLITILCARPSQIARLYKGANKEIPKGLLEIARDHQEKMYNEI